MRKVIYRSNSQDIEHSGFFHCWAGTMQDAYAIIEDATTGKMYRVNDDMFRYVQPPETRLHKNNVDLFNVTFEAMTKFYNSFEQKMFYVKECPNCKGREFPEGEICPVCNGEKIIKTATV